MDPIGLDARDIDWESFWGPRTEWPAQLRAAIETCFSTRFPVLVTWGPDLQMLYNEGYRQFMDDAKGADALGRPVLDVWSEIRDDIEPLFRGVLETGQPVFIEDSPLDIARGGQIVEAFFTWCYSALRDDTGEIVGVLDIAMETTDHIVRRRQLSLLRAVSEVLQTAPDDLGGIGTALVDALRRYDRDVLGAEVHVVDEGTLSLLARTDPRRSSGVDPSALDAVLGAREGNRVGSHWVAPLRSSGDTDAVGVVVLELDPHRSLDGPYRDFLEVLVSTVSSAMSAAVRRTRAFGELRTVSETLQLSMVPGLAVPGGTVGRYVPAVGSLAVGGDWFDAVPLPGGRTALLVGDSVGHGLPAAAVMGQLRSASRALLLDDRPPSQALVSLDRFAATVDGAICTTVVCLIVDPDAGSATWSSAGHMPILVVGEGGVRWLAGGRDVPLAVVPDAPRTEHTVALRPDDIVVVFSDGLVERTDEVIDVGLERLAEVVCSQLGEIRAQTALVGIEKALETAADAILDRMLPDGGRDDVALVLHAAGVPAS
jgi:hypothetical protein